MPVPRHIFDTCCMHSCMAYIIILCSVFIEQYTSLVNLKGQVGLFTVEYRWKAFQNSKFNVFTYRPVATMTHAVSLQIS